MFVANALVSRSSGLDLFVVDRWPIDDSFTAVSSSFMVSYQLAEGEVNKWGW